MDQAIHLVGAGTYPPGTRARLASNRSSGASCERLNAPTTVHDLAPASTVILSTHG